MGEQSYTLHDARAALSRALDVGDYPPEWATRTMIEHTAASALQDFVATFVDDHASTDYDSGALLVEIDSEDVAQLLAGLDNLRAPLPSVVEQERKQATDALAREVDDILNRMGQLNWTGDHLYGDALEDARVIVRHVLGGQKGWPVLERFRCPSLAVINEGEAPHRCNKQMPHADDHASDGGVGGATVCWTDEASLNPPVPYDAPEESTPICPSERTCTKPSQLAGRTFRCHLPEDHAGEHQDNGAMGVPSRWL